MWCCYRTNISHAAITNLNSVLAKWLSVRLQSKWLWIRFQLQSWKVLLRGKCSFTNFKNVWHGCSTVTGKILQQSLTRFFKSHWHDYSTVAGTILQQSLVRSFKSHWHNCSTVTGTIVQQSLARLFNSHWHDSSAVAGTILQQSWARFFLFSTLAEFFNSDVHYWRIVPCTRNMTHDPN